MTAEERSRLDALDEELMHVRDNLSQEIALARQRITALEEENEELRETIETLTD